ncbi:MAG TPA: hypothetical protein DD979_00570 [Gammaproteobacteria bacterium]|nr:hypothetical protein [Gammaproteobacteria bacterium]
MIFVDETKAYITLSATGKVLVVEPGTLAVTGELDLSAYAIDANGQTGGEDLNPEPSAGIVRDGKLCIWRCSRLIPSRPSSAAVKRASSSLMSIPMRC